MWVYGLLRKNRKHYGLGVAPRTHLARWLHEWLRPQNFSPPRAPAFLSALKWSEFHWIPVYPETLDDETKTKRLKAFFCGLQPLVCVKRPQKDISILERKIPSKPPKRDEIRARTVERKESFPNLWFNYYKLVKLPGRRCIAQTHARMSKRI